MERIIIPKSINDLAIFGGSPTFAHHLHVGQPDICDRDALFRRLDGMLDRRWLTNNGPLVHEFERKVEVELGVKHCIAMASGTVALETVLRALDLRGEVIVPAFTFIGTAHAVRWSGLTPVFCDIDLTTHNLDPRKVEKTIGPQTSAILAVHLWGRPCDIDELSVVARRHNLKLIFDAAHAFGSSYRGIPIGNFGAAEVFSFHATKVVSTFEGGAVVTNDDELAQRIRLMRNFGFADLDDVRCLGTNGKLSEAGAAMGLTSLESFERRVSRNRQWYRLYRQRLTGEEAIKCMAYDETERNNFRYMVIELNPAISQITRDELLQVLRAENVLARRYFFPGCHRMAPYRSELCNDGRLVETELLVERVITLPIGWALTMAEIEAICGIIRLCLARGADVAKRLP
jgi:dTDP-4-amino-4,6-dideoxygalactose transaminase